MSNTTEIKQAIQLLSKHDIKDLYQFILEIVCFNTSLSNMNKEIAESRFANGEVCVHCGFISVVKYGKVGAS